MNIKWLGATTLMTVATIGTGCANNNAPHTALSEAESAVSAAEAKEAQQVPQASLHLKMAKDGIESAKALMANKQYNEATIVLQRAQLDAELAESLATEEEAQKKAQEQVERVKSLQQANTQLQDAATYG